MSFDAFIAAAWQDHGGRPEEVARRLAGNLDAALTHLSADDRIAVLAAASSELAAQHEWKRAIAAYDEALRLAAPGLQPGSPALRALAGTWLEEERAEYRLARSLLQAGSPAGAIEHARRCVAICIAHDAPPLERLFGYAVLAIALSRAGEASAHATTRELALDQYAKVAPDEKQWCEAEVNELRS